MNIVVRILITLGALGIISKIIEDRVDTLVDEKFKQKGYLDDLPEEFFETDTKKDKSSYISKFFDS